MPPPPCTFSMKLWQIFTAFGRLELECCERKILLGWLELELVVGVVWEKNNVELEQEMAAEPDGTPVATIREGRSVQTCARLLFSAGRLNAVKLAPKLRVATRHVSKRVKLERDENAPNRAVLGYLLYVQNGEIGRDAYQAKPSWNSDYETKKYGNISCANQLIRANCINFNLDSVTKVLVK